MTKEEFIRKRPYLYHLTSRDNIERIKESFLLKSSSTLISSSGLSDEDKEELKQSRRPEGRIISCNGNEVHIRDQKPLIEKSLRKCLTEGMTQEEYIKLLNSKVFFWPTKSRLKKHYGRYKNDNISIIRVSTKDLFEINDHIEYANINTGATRSVPFYRGAHPRGPNTFIPASEYTFKTSKVAEVVFPDQCRLPENIEICDSPNGDWKGLT